MIDMICTFRYSEDTIKTAIRRLTCSLKSLSTQEVRVILFNASQQDIKQYVSKFNNVEYYYRPMKDKEPMCKGKMINHTVNSHVRTPYFFLSDVDIVYPPDYIQKMISVCMRAQDTFKTNVRVFPIVHNILEEYYNSDYDAIVEKNFKPEKVGRAPGLGLVSTNTFNRIGGFDEAFIGWGYEDILFNNRVSQTDSCVNARNVMTYHLYHEKSKTYDQEEKHNAKIFEKKLVQLKLKDKNNWYDFKE